MYYHFRLASVIIALGFTVFTTSAIAGSQVSSSYQINPTHNGITNFDIAPSFPMTHAWTKDLGGSTSYPVIADNRIFVTVANTSNYGTKLVALDLTTGAELWSKNINGTYYWSAAAYDNGKVFVTNFDGLIHAYDAATGSQLWSKQSANEYFVTGPITAANGLVYLSGDGTNSLAAFNQASGAEVWRSFTNGGGSSPTVSNSGVFVAFPCQVYGFDSTTGVQKWHYAGACSGGGGPLTVFASREVYAPTDIGNTIFKAATGKILSSFPYGGSPIIAGNYGYQLVSNSLQSFNVTNGSLQWIFTGDAQISLLPVKVNEYIFTGTTNGTLYAVDSKTGKPVWSTNVGSPMYSGACCTQPSTSIGAAGGYVVVPAGTTLSAYY